MKMLSLLRALVAASFPILAIALAAISEDLGRWLPVMIVAHLALPVITAFPGRRADAVSLDISLALVGSAYMVVMLLMPRGAWPGSTYVGVSIAYAVYAVVAALIFASLSSLRTAIRVQGWKRLRAQRVPVVHVDVHADAE